MEMGLADALVAVGAHFASGPFLNSVSQDRFKHRWAQGMSWQQCVAGR